VANLARDKIIIGKMKMDVSNLRASLAEFGQEHLLSYWDDLNEDEKSKLYKELSELDLCYVTQSFDRCIASVNTDGAVKLDDRMQPLPRGICGSVLDITEGESKNYQKLAFEQIASGKMAILLLAGGQGTRLGVAYPKGMYDVGLPSGKSLFQLQAERILKLEQLAKNSTGREGSIVWYIMTSASTVKPTTDFFKKNNYFGLKASNVVVFQQGTLPCFTFEGKIILDTKSSLARAPDGNGGLYRALKVDGILDDMTKRDIKYIQLYCVDNILVRCGDPLFTGYCISKNVECGNKVVPKGFPTEAVGITCKVDGEYQVVEYSEITSKAAELRNDDGTLAYSAANICIHFFTIDFLKRVVEENESQLVHHVAKKKIPYTDLTTGKQVKPDKPNGIKMEKFVFDVFQFTSADDKFAVWECIREDEFAPLKNADGASDFTPMHCRNALYALHQKYVRAAGGDLVGDDGKVLPQMSSPAEAKDKNNNEKFDSNNNEAKSQDLVCEISPLVTYAGEGLEHLVKDKRILVPSSNIGESY